MFGPGPDSQMGLNITASEPACGYSHEQRDKRLVACFEEFAIQFEEKLCRGGCNPLVPIDKGVSLGEMISIYRCASDEVRILVESAILSGQ